MIEVTLGSETDNVRIVKRSKNLRGVLEYARLYPVVSCCLLKQEDGCNLMLRFYDGALCDISFASYIVAKDWINKRSSWGKPTNTVIFSDKLIVYQWD